MNYSLPRAVTKTAALTAVIALALAGCARGSASPEEGSADPGITDTTINLGVTTPLSGPGGGPGSCGLGGFEAYMGRANDAGGIKFGDGKTRTINIKAYDDAYDPAKSVANFRQLVADGVFATTGALGTPTSLAVMPIANQEKVPQVFAIAGTAELSEDQEANPWSIGWFPTYDNEGKAAGELLAEANKPLTVAILSQNDDVGEAYVAGFKEGIEGSQVRIVDQATFESTDPTVDAQITKLAATKADVFFSANSNTPLTTASLLKAQQQGWLPAVFLSSTANSKATVIDPGNGSVFPAIYSTGFSKSPTEDQYANDGDVKQFMADMEKYSPKLIETMVPHCVWGYQMGATLEAAFQSMEEPTRQGLMNAIHGLRDVEIPMMLPGVTVDSSSKTDPPVSGIRVQKYEDGVYVPVDSFK